MKIEHVALWTEDIERLVNFYVEYFEAAPGNRYANTAKGFESCFLSFSGGARLEIMRTTTLSLAPLPPDVQRMGLTHLAIAVDSEHEVDKLTHRLKSDGFEVIDGPRRTGDGYYESVIFDPDGNRIEITA